MPFFQQFTGINAIIFYSPVFFSSLGSGDKTALESSCIVGAVNVLSTLVAVFGVDRVGRRALLLEAGVQMFVAEILVAILLGASAVPAISSICSPGRCIDLRRQVFQQPPVSEHRMPSGSQRPVSLCLICS
jgi:Sugar (and other) transporter